MTFPRTSRHGRRLEACFAWTANQAGPSGNVIAEGTRFSGRSASR